MTVDIHCIYLTMCDHVNVTYSQIRVIFVQLELYTFTCISIALFSYVNKTNDFDTQLIPRQVKKY